MASRNKSSIIRIGEQQFEFNKLVEYAKADLAKGAGNFWAQAAIVLLRRIYDLEKEAQKLRQGELFAPAQQQVGRRGV